MDMSISSLFCDSFACLCHKLPESASRHLVPHVICLIAKAQKHSVCAENITSDEGQSASPRSSQDVRQGPAAAQASLATLDSLASSIEERKISDGSSLPPSSLPQSLTPRTAVLLQRISTSSLGQQPSRLKSDHSKLSKGSDEAAAAVAGADRCEINTQNPDHKTGLARFGGKHTAMAAQILEGLDAPAAQMPVVIPLEQTPLGQDSRSGSSLAALSADLPSEFAAQGAAFMSPAGEQMQTPSQKRPAHAAAPFQEEHQPESPKRQRTSGKRLLPGALQGHTIDALSARCNMHASGHMASFHYSKACPSPGVKVWSPLDSLTSSEPVKTTQHESSQKCALMPCAGDIAGNAVPMGPGWSAARRQEAALGNSPRSESRPIQTLSSKTLSDSQPNQVLHHSPPSTLSSAWTQLTESLQQDAASDEPFESASSAAAISQASTAGTSTHATVTATSNQAKVPAGANVKLSSSIKAKVRVCCNVINARLMHLTVTKPKRKTCPCKC